MLEISVKAYGPGNWAKVRQHVPGRTDVQCRERWVNILDPSLNLGKWSLEEDELLKKAVEEYGVGKWSLVSTMVPNRTDNQCWRRWKTLHAKEVKGYKQIVVKRKRELVNNFVGREKERPHLSVYDFQDAEDITEEDTPFPKKKRKLSRNVPKSVKTRQVRISFPSPTQTPITSPSLPLVLPSPAILNAFLELIKLFSSTPIQTSSLNNLSSNHSFHHFSHIFFIFLFKQH